MKQIDMFVQKSITDLEKELENKKEQARFLYGRKKGQWGLPTNADSKRSNEIQTLTNRLRSMKDATN